MKKILTFAIMALLLGGFAFNASAQKKTTATQNKENVQQKEDWDKTLKEYETAVDQCVTAFQKMQKDNGKDASVVKEFNNALDKAEKLKNKIEKAKKELTRAQVNRFNKATQKLMQVYTKG